MLHLYTVIIFFVAGLIFKRIMRAPQQWVYRVNKWVIYLALPAMVFTSVKNISWSEISSYSIIAAWCSQISCMATVLILSKLFHWRRDLVGALLITSVLGNTSFIGYPIVIAFWGEQALPFAVLYDQFGSFLGLSLYAPVIIALYSSDGVRVNPWAIIKNIITFPPFLALLLGLIVTSDQIPVVIEESLELLAQTLIPLALFAIGLQFTIKLEACDRSAIVSALCIKMLVAPLAVFGLTLMLMPGVDDFKAAITQAAMPPMITASVLAMASGLAPKAVASIMSFGVVVSFVTLPIIYFLLA